MRIPENRIYKVRATARPAHIIREPNLGAGPAALANGMAPGIRGAIGAVGQQIQAAVSEARNPHWLTHLKLADQIATTGARTMHNVAKAEARRAEAQREEEDAAYMAFMRDGFYDSVDEAGNVVEGKIRTPWREAGDGGEEDGPAKALVRLDRSFDKTEYFGGLSAERKAGFNERRKELRQRYMNDAMKAQSQMMEQSRREAEERNARELQANVAGSMLPGSPNWEYDVNALAVFAADKAYPGGGDLWLDTFQKTSAQQYMKRGEAVSSAYALIPELTTEDRERAKRAEAFMEADLKNAAGRTPEQMDAMRIMYDDARRKRMNNMELSYKEAERDAQKAAQDWVLAKDGDEGEASRNEADEALVDALQRLPEGPRRDAASKAADDLMDESVADRYLREHGGDLTGENAVVAFNKLTDGQKKAARRMWVNQMETTEKQEAAIRKKVGSWLSGDASADKVLERLRAMRQSDDIGEAEFHAGIAELRDNMDYLKVFNGNAEELKRHEQMIMAAVKTAFNGNGFSLEDVFQFDKNGMLVYDGDGNPALADGYEDREFRQGYATGRSLTDYGRYGAVEFREYKEVTGETLAAAANLMRQYIAAHYMGKSLDGTTGALDQEKMTKYLSDVLAPDIVHSSNEMMLVQIQRYLSMIPASIMMDRNMKNESKRVLNDSKRATPEKARSE